MGNIYQKSISTKYKKYFEQIEDLSKLFPQYSIGNQSFIETEDEIGRKPWEQGKAGIPLAWDKQNNYVMVDHTDSHTLVIGTTGSKKSRLVAMPLVRVLGTAYESMVICDPKGEIYCRTASFLKEKAYEISVINLRAPMYGDRWNPLTIPYELYCKNNIDKAYEMINDFAESLAQADKSQRDPFWDNCVGTLFFGLAALLFKYCKENEKGVEYVHIENVIHLRNILFSRSQADENENFKMIMNCIRNDSIILSAIIGTYNAPRETKASILSVFDQKVQMFMLQPALLDMLSKNDIDFDYIGEKPVAIFLILPDEKTSYHGLISLFIKHSYEYLIYKAQFNANEDGIQSGRLNNRVNYILDEFASLPMIKDFPAMMSASRSRNIRFNLFLQSKAQLIQHYGEEAEIIQSNCNNWIFLTSKELKLLEEISALCGKTISDFPDNLLSTRALQRLNKEEGEVLLLCGRMKPCIAYLPDIEFYDNAQYVKEPIEKRQFINSKKIDVEVLNLTGKSEKTAIERINEMTVLVKKGFAALNEEIELQNEKIEMQNERIELQRKMIDVLIKILGT